MVFTVRLLRRHRLYSLISLAGLTAGISACLLLGMYVVDEVTFDNFHPEKEKIYRLSTKGSNITAGLTGLPIGPMIAEENQEIESVVRLLSYGKRVDVQRDQIHYNENGILYADSSFFSVFGYELIQGQAEQVLNRKEKIVLSQSMVEKYFPEGDALGKGLQVNGKVYQVSGIMADVPSNSDLQFSALVSMEDLNPQWAQVFNQDLFRIVCFTYLKFHKTPDPASLQASLDAFGEKHIRPWAEQNGSEEMYYYEAVPIEAVHFDHTNEFDSPKGNYTYVQIFGLVALFMLIIACINFINLSLARSAERSREIGIRKTLGAGKSSIRLQFFLETFIMSLLAYAISLILVELALPSFNQMAAKSFSLSILLQGKVILLSLSIIIAVSVLSASYPAFILSSFEPIHVLKGRLPRLGSSGLVRKSLLVIQFAFSMAMILGTLVVGQQMRYMKGQDLGFSHDPLLVYRIPSDTSFQRNLSGILKDIERLPSVENVALSSNVPGQGFGELMVRVETKNKLHEATMRYMSVDQDYLKTMDLNLIQGRNFNPDSAQDYSKAFIINQKTAEVYNWGSDAIGKRIQIGLLADDQATVDGKVIGVVEDFHFESLHHPVEPLAIQFTNSFVAYLTIKVRSDFSFTEEKIGSIWQKHDPGRITESFYLDEGFAEQYKTEERMVKIVGFLALLSILVSALGLYALTAFNLKQRTREIGVRKVLGANASDLAWIISSEFLSLLGLAFLLAVPFSYYLLIQWLDGFAYSISLDATYMLITAGIASLVTMSIIAYHAFKASEASAIYALKYESG